MHCPKNAEPRRGGRLRVRNVWCVPVLLGLLAAARAVAAEVTVDGVDGTQITGTVRELGAQVRVQTADGEVALAWDDVLALQSVAPGTTTAPTSGPATRPAAAVVWPLTLELVDGTSLGVRVTGGSETALGVILRGAQAADVHLSDVQALLLRALDAATAARVTELRATAAPTADVALVAKEGGELLTLRGTLQSVSAAGVRFVWNARPLELPWNRLRGVLLARPTRTLAPLVVALADGDRLAGRMVGGDAEHARLRTPLLGDVTLDVASVARIDVRSDRVTFLSEVQPARYVFTPLFAKRWNYGLDEGLNGGPLRLGGRRYARGIELHSQAVLTYALDGRFARFVAAVGISDDMGPRGDAVARVRGDGKVLWEGRVRGGQPAQAVSVALTGVRELALEVDYGEDLDLSDQVVWAAARLIR